MRPSAFPTSQLTPTMTTPYWIKRREPTTVTKRTKKLLAATSLALFLRFKSDRHKTRKLYGIEDSARIFSKGTAVRYSFPKKEKTIGPKNITKPMPMPSKMLVKKMARQSCFLQGLRLLEASERNVDEDAVAMIKRPLAVIHER